ncbi:(2Fe-2S)-binding protein [Polycladidibacter hongkongensis]|uniref:(2Fe-2S)-binding protein n=1 Tax=Polycladidibacter hongkongensis TaxID=1647556 RepID=UPI0008321F2B|nr:(2Fe-2S)-binding protein [Pseudovibrio hongkongensis]
MHLTVNGKSHQLDADPQMPLLWALRDVLNVKGPKYGCGVAACGACTVLIDGEPMRSCSVPLEDVQGEIITVEGLADTDGTLSQVQEAWMDLQVPQCGYCQSGQILAATALLKENPSPSSEDIDDAMSNICRCGTYPQIRNAIETIAAHNQKQEG